MTEHTKTDGLPGIDVMAIAITPERAPLRNEKMGAAKVECNACPVLCQISEGRTGACDRYANRAGVLVRVDPVVLLRRAVIGGMAEVVPFSRPAAEAPAGDVPDWNGDLLLADEVFVTGVGSSTTYPDYKPAPFIVGSKANGVDMVTVVTEGIFSYCSFKIKIDTDRFLGAEQANVRYKGEVVGHVTTAEYGSQMLSLGGVHHLTGGSKKEGRMTAELMQLLGNKKPVDITIDGGARLVVQAGRPPIVNGVEEQRMRVGCGSAAVGIFARQFAGVADEVVVVDDHITGVLTEHQAGRCLDMPKSGIEMRGRKSTPGRYFQVANPGDGWGGTDIADPLSIIEGWEEGQARPAAADDLDHRRACAVVCARRGAAARRAADAGGSAPHRAAHRRELRTLAVQRALPRRRRRQPARGRQREPGAADARHQARAGQRDLRWRAGLCVAGRRHHGDGGRDAHAGQQLRHRAHAGHRGADRVQHAARRLRGAGRAHRACVSAGAGAGARCVAGRWRAARAAMAGHRRRESVAARATADAGLNPTPG
jgi:hypothetical protein